MDIRYQWERNLKAEKQSFPKAPIGSGSSSAWRQCTVCRLACSENNTRSCAKKLGKWKTSFLFLSTTPRIRSICWASRWTRSIFATRHYINKAPNQSSMTKRLFLWGTATGLCNAIRHWWTARSPYRHLWRCQLRGLGVLERLELRDALAWKFSAGFVARVLILVPRSSYG